MPESFECLPSRGRSATRRIAVIAVVATVVPALGISTASASRLAAVKGEASGHAPRSALPDLQRLQCSTDRALAPRTQFTMAPDGSSGLNQGGAGSPTSIR